MGQFGPDRVEVEFSPDDAQAVARSEHLTCDQVRALEAAIEAAGDDGVIGKVGLWLDDEDAGLGAEQDERLATVTEGHFDDNGFFIVTNMSEDSGEGT